MEEDFVNYGKDIINQCFLPELPIEIGNDYLPATYFAEFQKILEITIPQLFDFVQMHEDLVLNTGRSTIELRAAFLSFLCEQNWPQTDIQTQNTKWREHLQSLLQKYFLKIIDADHAVEEKLWFYYKSHLRADKWRKQLGAAYGFAKFLQLQYAERKYKELERDKCLFILSTGLLFKETHESSFKYLGLFLLDILLSNSNRHEIEALNIHNVVYDSLIMDIPKVETVKDIEILWKCLLICTELVSFENSYEWNRIDELIEHGLRKIILESNWKIHNILFLAISRLCIIFSSNKDTIRPLLAIEKTPILEDVDNFRSICTKVNSRSSLRWAKKLLKVFVMESPFLQKKNPFVLLQTIHICYLVCIFPIPLNVLKQHLEQFIQNFIPCLITVTGLNDQEDTVRRASKAFLQTILHQIDNSNCKDMEKYKISLQDVLSSHIYSNI